MIQEDLNLSKQEIWTSSIAGVGSTIAIRFILGPLCDKYGPRIFFLVILCSSAIPAALTGLVNSASGLVILRSFIGIAGGSE
jgi:MFS transporter, NNP family, nitrate/nitrite transporter